LQHFAIAAVIGWGGAVKETNSERSRMFNQTALFIGKLNGPRSVVLNGLPASAVIP
jgi:phage terminase large subunit-like protein